MSDRGTTVSIIFKAVADNAAKGIKAFISGSVKALKVLGGAALAAAGALAGMIAKTVSLSDTLMNASDRTGASAEFLSAMGFHARQSGSSLGALEKSLQNVAKGAVTGSKSFSKWGVNIKDANGDMKSAQTLWISAAEKLSRLKSHTAQMAAAQDLFGKAGKELLPIVKQGAAGIDEMRASAEAAGVVIDSLTVRLGDEFGDQIAKSKEQTNGMFAQISQFLLPILIVLIQRFNETGAAVTNWMKQNKALIESKLTAFLIWIADSALPAIAVGVDLVAKVWLGWKVLFQTLQFLAAAFVSGVLDGFSAVAGAAGDLAAKMGADGIAASLQQLSQSSAAMAGDFAKDADIASGEMAKTAAEIRNTETAIGNFGAKASGALRQAIADASLLKEKFAALGPTGSQATGEAPVFPGKKKKKSTHDPFIKGGEGGEAKKLARERAAALKAEQQAVKQLQDQYQSLGATMGEALGVAFASVVTGADKAGQAFKEMGKQMLLSILAVAEQQIMAAAASGGAQAGASASSLPWPANLIIAPIAAAAMFGLLRGFLGKLHTGGVVPGPMGQERMMVVQAGEEVDSIAERRRKREAPDRSQGGGPNLFATVQVQALTLQSRATQERAVEHGLVPLVDSMQERGKGFGRNQRGVLRGRG